MPSQLPTFTDEKLEEYLGIWTKLFEQDYRKMLDIELTFDFKFTEPSHERYTLKFGEDMRELTESQAWRVKDWLDSLPRNI